MSDDKLTPGQKVAKKIIGAFHDALLREGINEKYLARKLKLELNANETKVYNPAGNIFKKGLIYSKPLTLWNVRQKAREDAQKLLDLYPAEKHIFPDKEGNPQDLSGLSNLEAATRLVFLMSEAMKRKKEANGESGGEDKRDSDTS